MLILTRKLHERIRLLLPDGTEVWLTCFGRNENGSGFSIGIEAPPEIKVEREEIVPRQGGVRRADPQLGGASLPGAD